MATVTGWNPFGVSLNIAATAGTVTRISATQFRVVISASWSTYYSGNKTNYGMTASSGGGSATINPFGTKANSGSGSFTGTYSISGNGAQSKSITVTFRNFNNDNGNSSTYNIVLSVGVPAWTSYTVTYNANNGTGAPGNQTKWKDQTLKLSTTIPTRTGYSFLGWSTSSTATSATYTAGANFTSNANTTLYAVWKADTYAVTYDVNGGTGDISDQTKTYGVDLTLSSVAPTRTNYTFLGWATSANATTATYTSGATYTDNTPLTLYAVWELSYVKPSINNLNVYRCTSEGVFSEEGTYYKIEFSWSCDKTIGVNKIKSAEYSLDNGTPVAISVDTTAMAGTVSLIAGGSMSIETSHVVKVTVYDTAGATGNNFTSQSSSIPAATFPIDLKAGGKGVAFGKPADTDDLYDVNFLAKFRKAVELLSTLDVNGQIKTISPTYPQVNVDNKTDESVRTAVRAKRSASDGTVLSEIWMGSGGTGIEHGIRSETLGKWLIHTDGTDIFIGNTKIYDFVIERGTSGSWRYEKTKEGRVRMNAYLTPTFTTGYTTISSLPFTVRYTRINIQSVYSGTNRHPGMTYTMANIPFEGDYLNNFGIYARQSMALPPDGAYSIFVQIEGYL